MIQKLFPLDKNYILRQAQFAMEDVHLELMIQELRESYTQLFNPLLLMDSTYALIMEPVDFPKQHVRLIYRQLCGIYRYRHGDNQLELLFDGKSHFEKFQEDWNQTFLNYTRDLGRFEPYVKSMLRMTIFYDTESRATWAENTCKAFINQFFGLKVIKRQGELLLKAI